MNMIYVRIITVKAQFYLIKVGALQEVALRGISQIQCSSRHLVNFKLMDN